MTDMSDQVRVHKKDKCRYCNTDKICKTCHMIIKCDIITSCVSCGGLYGRPLMEPISAGCLLIEYPYITVIFETNKNDELKGTLNDIGGKFDPDLDRTILDTVARESKEELGILLCLDGTEPFVDVGNDGIIYRCYLIDNGIKKKYIMTGIVPENPVVKMKIKHFLGIVDSPLLERRLKSILKSTIQSKVPLSVKTPLAYLKLLLNK
jgi:hypothetical protein